MRKEWMGACGGEGGVETEESSQLMDGDSTRRVELRIFLASGPIQSGRDFLIGHASYRVPRACQDGACKSPGFGIFNTKRHRCRLRAYDVRTLLIRCWNFFGLTLIHSDWKLERSWPIQPLIHLIHCPFTAHGRVNHSGFIY